MYHFSFVTANGRKHEMQVSKDTLLKLTSLPYKGQGGELLNVRLHFHGKKPPWLIKKA